MNQGSVFVPSSQLQERPATSVAEKAAAAPALDPSELSEEELAMMAADDGKGLAKLYLNGELCRIGLRWLPGMEEKWNKQ